MSDFNELTAKLKACLTRNSHNWSDSVMRTCEHCGQWEMTVIGDDEMTTCASCCDAEYASNLVNNLELAIDALEAAEKRVTELEALRKEREAAVPVYQERRFHVSGKKQIEYWAEINKGAYQYLPESERRIVYAAPPAQPVAVPEWTNEECFEFLSIAFRHAEIKGDFELDDLRLGVKMVNESRAAMLAAPGKEG